MGALQALAVGSIPSSSTTLVRMLHKLRQQIQRHRFTSSDRLPNRRARRFLLNYLRLVRTGTASFRLRGAMGLIQ